MIAKEKIMSSIYTSGQANQHKILAKSNGETLSEHTIACLNATQRILDALPFSGQESLKRDVILAVAMHDVGKAASGFQKVVRGEQESWQEKRHEIISAAFASNIEGISPAAIFGILTHHKSIPSDGISELFGCLPWAQIPLTQPSNVWKEMADEWKQNIVPFMEEWKKICSFIGQNILPNELKPLSLQLSWLERTNSKRGQRKSFSYPDRHYFSMVRGLVIASDHLGSANKTPPAIPELRRFTILQRPRPFQALMGSIEGSAILRAPTGSGKTEAALMWAQRNQHHNGRLYYILPYTASINAMYRRLAAIFNKENVGALHHRATEALYSILETDTNVASHLDRQDIAKTLATLAREMWFPIRVCTPHQIIRYTLRGKGWEYMLTEFPNACFIFDEIHAYDPRVVGLTLRSAQLATKWGAKCLFLSATLPMFMRQLITESIGNIPFIEPNPSEEDDRKILDKKRHIIAIKDGSIKDDIEAIIGKICSNPSTLIVCNHVKTSQDVYSLLKKRLSGGEVELLHSRFNQRDRILKENKISNNPPPKVLVATQVVEVSLDIDFSQALFEPAPIDALIQRMGRVNRTGKRAPAEITIFIEQVNRHHLYCECDGRSHKQNCRVKLTLNELEKLKEKPVSEKDLVESADRVYGNGYDGEDRIKFEEGFNHPDIKDFEANLLAGAHQSWVEVIIEKTDGIIELLPKSLLNEYVELKNNGLWIEANSLLVPVRTKSMAWLKPRIDMSHDPWVVDLVYTSEKGLELE